MGVAGAKEGDWPLPETEVSSWRLRRGRAGYIASTTGTQALHYAAGLGCYIVGESWPKARKDGVGHAGDIRIMLLRG